MGCKSQRVIINKEEETTQIAPEEHHKEWKIQEEETSSANNAMGFKDHKATVYGKNMSKLDRLLWQFPCQVGFTLEGHQKMVDYKTLKKAGMLAIEKFRTIQLMVAAFNVNNKRMGQLAMKRAENSKLILWWQGVQEKIEGSSLISG